MSEELRSLNDIGVDYIMSRYHWRNLTAEEFRVALLEAVMWGATSRWISTADRLPENDREVLALVRDDGVGHFIYKISAYNNRPCFEALDRFIRGYEFDVDQLSVEVVSHWMPIPEPPKEDI